MNERLRVCSFESRRSSEMGKLIEKFGGEAFVAPSMQEVALSDNSEALAFGSRLLAGEIDVVVFLTGVGASALRDVIEQEYDSREFLEALRACRICVRGPKPAAIIRKWGLSIDVRAPEPNTWRELVGAIDEADVSVDGALVALQEYGQPSVELREALAKRGATVTPVTVYKWALPDDTRPLASAVTKIAAGEFGVVLVTSAQQMRNAFEVAEQLDCVEAFRAGLAAVRLASIGPTATDALRTLGLRVDVEPDHPKMAPLVRAALEDAGA